MMANKALHALTSPTWNWLKMNSADMADVPEGKVEAIDIKLPKGASDIHIMDIKSQDDVVGSSFNYNLSKDSHLTLVQVFRLSKGSVYFSDIDGSVDEGATFKLIQIFLGGDSVYMGARAELIGKGASFEVDSAYMLTGSQKLDINYIANHIGKRTTSKMTTDGVLRDNAFKIYRATIDFKRGCAGAVGSENEDVLLMDEGVVNKSIPIILCQEEDVEGNHGATIGNLSDELLFYAESRGIPKDDVYEMMAKARIDSVIGKLPECELKNELLGE